MGGWLASGLSGLGNQSPGPGLADAPVLAPPGHGDGAAAGDPGQPGAAVVDRAPRLLDWAHRDGELEHDPNPFALVTLAHLRTRATRGDPESRYQAKCTLVRLLYRRGWERQRILDLFSILDWMMRLTPELERQLWQDIQVIEGELQMPYVTSVERMAIERGFNQGYLQGVQSGEEKGRLAPPRCHPRGIEKPGANDIHIL